MSGLFGSDPQQMPEPKVITPPTVNTETVDRNTSDTLRRRRGSAATVLTSTTGSNAGTGGSVASKTLLGM